MNPRKKPKSVTQWAKLAGKQYKYYMVFETKQPDYPGAYSLERFMEIVKDYNLSIWRESFVLLSDEHRR